MKLGIFFFLILSSIPGLLFGNGFAESEELPIPPGGRWNPRIQVKQSAATLWYHPHLMGTTAGHVYRGPAGLFIIDDEYSAYYSGQKDRM